MLVPIYRTRSPELTIKPRPLEKEHIFDYRIHPDAHTAHVFSINELPEPDDLTPHLNTTPVLIITYHPRNTQLLIAIPYQMLTRIDLKKHSRQNLPAHGGCFIYDVIWGNPIPIYDVM